MDGPRLLKTLGDMKESARKSVEGIDEYFEKRDIEGNPQYEINEENLSKLNPEEYSYAFVSDYPEKDKITRNFAIKYFLSFLNPRRYFKKD